MWEALTCSQYAETLWQKDGLGDQTVSVCSSAQRARAIWGYFQDDTALAISKHRYLTCVLQCTEEGLKTTEGKIESKYGTNGAIRTCGDAQRVEMSWALSLRSQLKHVDFTDSPGGLGQGPLPRSPTQLPRKSRPPLGSG